MRRLPKGTNAERRVEAFLEHHIEMIEPDLKLLRRQYPLKMIVPHMIGKIDLFCFGADRADVAVELLSAPINANDLGQVMVYWDVLNRRSTSHRKPSPRLYIVGPSITHNFLHALNVLDGGKQINLTVKLFSILPGVNIDDEEWAVEVHDHEPHMRIPI
jgi:RecB family endonuclease NucS